MTDYSQKRAGNYNIIRKLGDGGFATVYLAQHTVLEKKAAVKFLLEDWIDEEDVVARFFDEARTMERLHDNPCIVKIIDIATIEKCKEEGLPPYFIMEYIDGKSLEELMKSDAGFALEDVVRIMGSALSALQHCHNLGVVHRDIKPSNFMINSNGDVKLTDFGIAKACKNTSKTGEGLTLGSTDYMSPEQALGKRDLDYRSDIYSLGVTLYQMVCDRLPFVGDSPNAIALKHIQEKPVPPASISEYIPVRLSDVIMKAMEKEREHRFQSCDEMLEALKKLSEPEEPVVADIKSVDLSSLVPDAGEDAFSRGFDPESDSHATTKVFATRPPPAMIATIRVILIVLGFTGLFLLIFKGYSIFTQVHLSLNTIPEGAFVSVNREQIGVSPLELDLQPAGYLISFTMPGYATATVYHETQARQKISIRQKLFGLSEEDLNELNHTLESLAGKLGRLPDEPPRLKKEVPAYEKMLRSIDDDWEKTFRHLSDNADDERFNRAFVDFCARTANLPRAEKMYETLVLSKPSAATFTFAGIVKKKLKNDKDALRLFMEAWNKDPNNRNLLNTLGDFFIDDQKPDRARQYLEMSLFLYPEQSDVRKKLLEMN